MEIEIQITNKRIEVDRHWNAKFSGGSGAVAEFSGIVRDLENGGKISALEYEAYSPMAETEMRRILEALAEKHPCLAAKVIHRIGIIPVGETAIYISVASSHRSEAFLLQAEFMNRLKQDVPIWKVRSLPAVEAKPVETDSKNSSEKATPTSSSNKPANKSLQIAIQEISSRCQSLPGIHINLSNALGHVLQESVSADEDFPATDRSTRDGYAILADDSSETFTIVDTLHAADWKPRDLKSGQTVRVATGSSLPCAGLRVVMQEDVERSGDKIKILQRESALNIRKRGEEMSAGQTVLPAGTTLHAGTLALLATMGCTEPLVNPKLRVRHFTTGDEIVSPDQKPGPGQVRDSNSILIRALLQKFPCEIQQQHLPEDFELAKAAIGDPEALIQAADVILVSGGASVGQKDFTRPLLEWLGFEIVFSRTNIRPGAPLIFGALAATASAASKVAFGLPGNPLSHFVCFHLFVATALAKLIGAEPAGFSTGVLAAMLDDTPNSRETLWPAHWEMQGGKIMLTPQNWNSSGDVTALLKTNALIRVPPNQGSLLAGAPVEFLPL